MSKPTKNVYQPAWDLFCKGNLAGAETSAMQFVQQTGNSEISPVPDIMIVKAYYLARMRRFADARRLFGRILEDRPDDQYAQEGYLLSLADQLTEDADELPGDRTPLGQILLGIGTGRCGSTTLTRLFQGQSGCYSSHEHPPRLRWGSCDSRIDFHVRRFKILSKSFHYAADVSHWWLPHIHEMIASFPNIRVIALMRNQEDTVDSFLKIKGGCNQGAINHWIEHDGAFWRKNSWDECYPKHATKDMREAISLYWEQYYQSIENLRMEMPSLIRIFDTNSLSNPDTQSDILRLRRTQNCGGSSSEQRRCGRRRAYDLILTAIN